ncbi:iron(III) transport system ATP-binding protein [Agrobacterium vitis]|nr:iron(III) transport system ATP-binding protein [Agrobacterium vitis]MBE1438927.1 iron(III) transport system ATP-binding protein [Agrobacterium vitis]
MAKLVLHHLVKDFGSGKAAVNDISMTVREGGFLALLGPSGCGKTTVLRMIAGFEKPSDGSIHLGERLLSDASGVVAPERRNMAMVFQSYALWPHMRVSENVGYPLKVRGVSGSRYREKVMEALKAVRLETYADRRPADLSGGQRQRVALARCLVTEPDVVLLDEPLANLDRHLRAEMEETFREFHARSGATMVYVTHDQAEAMALATDVAVMSEGRLMQMGTPEEIYARPEGRVVGGLIGQGAIVRLHSDWPDRRAFGWEALKAMVLSTTPDAPLTDILIRPADVRIDPAGLLTTVESATFLGERYQLQLVLPDGQRLLAFSRQSAKPADEIRVIISAGWRL